MFLPPRGSLGSFSLQEEDEEEFDIFNPMPFVVQPIQDLLPTEAQLREAALPDDWEERIISVYDTVNMALFISGWIVHGDPNRDDHTVWWRGNSSMDLFAERMDLFLENETQIMRYKAEGEYWIGGSQVGEDAFVLALVQ